VKLFIILAKFMNKLIVRLCLKHDDTRAETRFGLSVKRTSLFKLAGESVQSTTGSRGVRISRQRLYYL
jgi:hypothetical protein